MAEKPGVLDGPDKIRKKETKQGPRKLGVEPVAWFSFSYSLPFHLY